MHHSLADLNRCIRKNPKHMYFKPQVFVLKLKATQYYRIIMRKYKHLINNKGILVDYRELLGLKNFGPRIFKRKRILEREILYYEKLISSNDPENVELEHNSLFMKNLRGLLNYMDSLVNDKTLLALEARSIALKTKKKHRYLNIDIDLGLQDHSNSLRKLGVKNILDFIDGVSCDVEFHTGVSCDYVIRGNHLKFTLYIETKNTLARILTPSFFSKVEETYHQALKYQGAFILILLEPDHHKFRDIINNSGVFLYETYTHQINLWKKLPSFTVKRLKMDPKLYWAPNFRDINTLDFYNEKTSLVADCIQHYSNKHYTVPSIIFNG